MGSWPHLPLRSAQRQKIHLLGSSLGLLFVKSRIQRARDGRYLQNHILLSDRKVNVACLLQRACSPHYYRVPVSRCLAQCPSSAVPCPSSPVSTMLHTFLFLFSTFSSFSSSFLILSSPLTLPFLVPIDFSYPFFLSYFLASPILLPFCLFFPLCSMKGPQPHLIGFL